MGKLLFDRFIQLILLLWILSLVTFILMKLAPGDPIRTILKPDEVAVTTGQEEALRRELGLDQPVVIQYVQWLSRLLQLDLGTSFVTNQPVWDELIKRLWPTILLTLGGLTVMTGLALVLGILSAWHPNRLFDHISRTLAFAGASIPSFWLGILFIYLFSYQLRWLPSMGSGSFAHLILPSVTLGLGMSAVYARLLRAGLLESLSQDYVRAARARGLSWGRIMVNHALKSAFFPVITMLGLSLGSLLGGTVVVETLFSWPGLGKLAVESIFKRDYPVIQGYVLFTGVFVVIVNLLVDLSYRFLDPRIRFQGGEPQ